MCLAAISVQWLLEEIRSPLVLFGFAGQFIFFLRFAVQWLASERRGRSHIPIAFWYLSLVGGGMTFIYAVLKPDLVFMIAQALGLTIYIRNLMLIYGRRRRAAGRRGFPVTLDNDLADGPSSPTQAQGASRPPV